MIHAFLPSNQCVIISTGDDANETVTGRAEIN